MAWNRHHKKEEEQTPETVTPFEKAIAETAEKNAEEKETEKIVEIIKEVYPEAHVEVIPKPPVIKKPPVVKSEEKKPERKKRVETKEFNNCGIVGDTIDVREFRAIVKKKGEQINVVLTGLICAYNKKNYNL